MPAAKRDEFDNRGIDRWWHGRLAAAVAAVFVAAVLIRLPACYESFWVDELHSAWAVWDGIDQVQPRAAAGNQTPVYFFGLWFWRQLVGRSEVALRMSSVLAMSVASVVVVIAVTRQTGRLAAGVIAGGFLVLDSNAIFFGTELRPYALVVLCATIAIALFGSILRRLSESHARNETNAIPPETAPRGTAPRGTVGVRWVWLVAVTCFAALIQPTSAGALIPLTALAAAVILWRGAASGERISITHWLLAGGLIVATGFALTQSAAADAWSERDNWKAFASSQHWKQMWTVWPWKPLVIWPAVPALAWAVYRGHRAPAARSVWPWLLALAIGVTGATWLAARSEWIPLWHRRYMVSVLPMLAWVGGAFWGVVAEAVGSASRRFAGFLLQPVVVAAALTLFAWNQGTLQRLLTGDPVLVRRHEGWREAVEWVAAQRQPDDLVWVAAGLIESQELLRRDDGPVPAHRRDYLKYMVGGPYRLSGAHPIGPVRFSLASNIRMLADGVDHDVAGEPRSLWILARFPARKLETIWKGISTPDARMEEAIRQRRVVAFGGVTVVQIQLPNSP